MSIRSSFTLLSFLLIFSCTPQDNEQAQNAVAELQQQLAEAQDEITMLKDTQAVQPGLIHSVFFWLKEDLTEEEQKAFLAGVESLREISAIGNMYVGPVAPTEARGVVDNSYNIALIVHFDDVAGQDAYQVDPIHLKFVDEQQDKWTKVIVYDNLVE